MYRRTVYFRCPAPGQPRLAQYALIRPLLGLVRLLSSPLAQPSALSLVLAFSVAARLVLVLDMEFSITPEWVTKLRHDVEEWDDRVRLGRKADEWQRPRRWTWPELAPPPLKYTGDAAERVRVLQS